MTEEITDEYLEGCPKVVFVAWKLLDSADHKEQARAVRMLNESSDYNHPRVQYMLGYTAELGRGIPVDIEKAKTHFRNAMSVPYASLQFNLAVEFSVRHLLGTLTEMEVEWYERAVQLGSSDALWGLAHRLQRGLGCKRDYDRAMRLYIAAAAAGDPHAAEDLGEEYCYCDVPDLALAAKYFGQAADEGFVNSQIKIGKMYWYGEGVPCCPETALLWFRKAADQGSHEALVQLGMSLCEPQFDFYSPVEAFGYFCKALDAQSEDTVRTARWNLGLCFRDGEGVKTDKNQAAAEFLCAFNLGHMSSCNWLARLASEGVFPPNDQRTAADWNKLAEEVRESAVHPREQ